MKVVWNPSRRHLRYFAWALALVLVGLTLAGTSPSAAWSLRLAASAVFALGTVIPATFRWPYVALLLALYPIGRAVPSLNYPSFRTLLASFRLPGRLPWRRRSRPGTHFRRRLRPTAMIAARSFDKL
jgi:hypothetical protein